MRSSQLFTIVTIVGLLIFQGWLIKYYAIEFPGFPVEKLDASKDSASWARPAWIHSPWIPDVIEEKLYQISAVRKGAVLNGGNTLVDADVSLNSVAAFVMYFPRALQLGLLSPLPEFWQGEASSPAMTMARKVVGAVTVVFYGSLVGLLFSMLSFRKRLGFWVIFTYCLIGILVYAYTYPNIGTLLRYRYGFYMLLISFGTATIAEYMYSRINNKRNADKA